MIVYVDGVQKYFNPGFGQSWGTFGFPMPPGAHEIEWVFQRNVYSPYAPGAAWMDDVKFVAQ